MPPRPARARPPPAEDPEELPGQLGVELVARAVGDDVTGQVDAHQRQVAEEVEDLVPDALVAIPEFVADHPVRPEDQEVPLRGPRADPGLAERASASASRRNVRLADSSDRKLSGVTSTNRDWRPIGVRVP